MPTPEQEQIAALVAPIASQVVELLTVAVKQVLIEERSHLISSLINEVNSHLSATLKSYFEEQLAIQKQEFQSELQTKIDELKFQHYQQLERLGQAVEELMSSQPSDEFSEEILDDIYEEIADEELDQFTSIEFKSEEFAEEDLDLEAIESESLAIAQELIIDQSLAEDEDLDQLESELFDKEFNLIPSELVLEMVESETSEIDLELDLFAVIPTQEPLLASNFDEFSNQVDEDEEFNQFESELFGDHDSSQSEEEIEDVILDTELNLFAETSSSEVSKAQEELSLDPFADMSLESQEFDESPEIIYTGEEFEFALEDLSLGLDFAEDPKQTENEDLTEFNKLFGDNESDSVSIVSLQSATLESDQDLDLFNFDNQEELILNSEFDQLEQNIQQETEDLDLDDELNFFAETTALDYLNDEMEMISESNLEDEIRQSFDPFADLSPELDNKEIGNTEVEKVSQASEEIIYEGEEYEYIPDPEISLELDQLSAELNESGGMYIEVNRLNLELEQELSIVFAESLSEIGDADLSEFADSESENGFWNSDLEIEHPDSTQKDIWHLGIDFGYSGIRACLFNQATGQVYPLAFDGAEQIIANIDLNVDGGAIALQGFKQFLRLGIPYQIGNEWQPKLKWINNQTLSLKDFQVAAQQLFNQILNQIKNFATNSDLSDPIDIANLETVILGHPHSWSDAYIFNLREAVLASGLINDIEKVLVIDQAITFGMRSAAFTFPAENSKESSQLFLDSGAFTTALSFTLGSERRFSDLEYAGLGINQDIILQLLFSKTKDKFPATKFIKSGEPNPIHRADLQQHLLNSAIGIESLAIAEQIKLFFSEQPNIQGWQGNVGGKSLKISRSELEIKVIQPFIQSLNDAIDLMIFGTKPEDITEIAIAGGTMQLPSIHQWLEAKFANAQVSILPSSNLAHGLAIAPLYSQYLDINRHQYSDFFLLSEICALNLQEPLTLGGLMKKLQNRGVNAKACSDRLAKILSGQLPAGIFPWQEPEKFLVLADPNLHPHLLDANLFTPLGNDLYEPNPTSTQLLGAYLKMLESSINQSFSEPLVFPSFAAERIPEVIA